MKDIENRGDVIKLVDNFYEKIFSEPRLSPVFESSRPHLKEHLVSVYNFWDNMIFQSGVYNGGMMWAHIQRNNEIPFTIDHFERWLALWFLSVDESFKGENSNFVKDKAYEIALILKSKLIG